MMRFAYLFLCAFLPILAEGSGSNEIKIDAFARCLVAPEGHTYQWYCNGVLLPDAHQQQLPVSKSGSYEVYMLDKEGNMIRQATNIFVSAAGNILKIYTIGDSTMQEYAEGYYPRRGFGQELPFFFRTENVQVINRAAGGTSSKSFYNDAKLWPTIRNVLQPGDFVFIAFGINDRATDTARNAPTSVNGGSGLFESYLTRYINETRAKGAFPVLLTPVRRGTWQNGQPYDAWHDHPIAVRNVAKNLNVPLIDIDAKQKVVMQAMGEAYISRFWNNIYPAGEYPNFPTGSADNLHLQQMGAIEIAKMVVEGIQDLAADKNLATLIPYIKPQFEVKVASNLKDSDSLITRTTAYPEGITVTVKTIPKAKQLKNFINWYNGSNSNVTAKTLYSFKMGGTPASYLANFKGGVLLGVEEEVFDTHVYPNPFTENIQLTGVDRYAIYNSTGAVLSEGECQNGCQVGNHLASGLYLLQTQTGSKINTTIITKQ